MSHSNLTLNNIVFLVSGILLSAVAVSIYVISNFGVSTVSSIPLVLSSLMPNYSLGLATILFQLLLIVVLIYRYKFQPKYAASFILGVFFGVIVDLCSGLWDIIPIQTLPNFLLFLIALFLLPFGISLTIRSQLTALPFDLIISDLSINEGQTVAKVKLWFDVICVGITVLLSFVFFRTIIGIGLGTIISMVVNGKLIQFYLKVFSSSEEIVEELVEITP